MTHPLGFLLGDSVREPPKSPGSSCCSFHATNMTGLDARLFGQSPAIFRSRRIAHQQPLTRPTQATGEVQILARMLSLVL